MTFNVVIPARFGSTRFPGKPLVEIAGKPMVAYVIDRAREAGAGEVIVATDDTRVISAVQTFGCEVMMTRSDHVTGTDRIAEVVTVRNWKDDVIVVNAQGDEPLLPPYLIQGVADALNSHPDAAIATACHPIKTIEEFLDPNAVKVVTDERGYAMYFSRAPIPWPRDDFAKTRDALPGNIPAFRHIGIYAYRCGFLRKYADIAPVASERFESLEQLRALAHGYRIAVIECSNAPPPGIDTPADLERLLQREWPL